MAALTFPTPTQLKNIGEPSANSDAATKYYVDQQIGSGNAAFANNAGTVTASAQPNITSVGNLVTLTVIGNLTAGNVNGGNLVVANYFSGNGSLLTGITATTSANANYANYSGTAYSITGSNVSGQVGNALISGTVYTNAQPNITSVGTLTSLAVTGNITAGNIDGGNAVAANYFVGNGALLTGITASSGNANYANYAGTAYSVSGSNVSGQVSNALVAGTIYTNAQPNITSVGTLTSLDVTGNVAAGNANLGNAVSANYFIGSGNNLSNIQGSSISGQVGNALVASTVYTNAQPNITSVGTLTSLSVTGNLSSGNANLGNLTTTNNLSVTTYVTSNLIPNANVTYTLGNSTNRWKDLWLSNSTIYFDANSTVSAGTITNGNSNVSIADANGNITFTSAGNANVVIVTGTGVNISGTLNTGSGIITGNGNGLSSLVGANVTGQVGNALVAGTVYTAVQPNITSVGTLTDVSVSGNAVIAGNLVVGGNTTYINVTTFNVKDPIIELGGGVNGAPLTNNDGKDRGTLLHYYTSAAVDAFMGWDNSNGEFAFGSNVSVSSEVVTFNSLGNVRAGYFIGNGSQLTGISASSGNANYANYAGNAYSVTGSNVSGQVGNALVAGTVYTNAQPNITSVGTLTGLSISGDIIPTANVTYNLGNNTNRFKDLYLSGNTINLGDSNISANTTQVVITNLLGGQFIIDGTGTVNSSNISTYSIANGSSNVSIENNGNVKISAAGNANVVVVTGTGANINGTLNTTGNVSLSGSNVNLGSVSNLHISGGTANYLLSTDGTGNLSWAVPPSMGIAVDNFTGNGVQANYTLTNTPANINCTLVSIAGLFQPRTVYSLTGNVITFSSAPSNTAPIEITTFINSSGGGGGGGGGGITAQDLLSPFLLMGA